MGNAHTSERRKSTDAGDQFSAIGGQGGGGGRHGVINSKRGSLPGGHDDMMVGPVAITAGVHQNHHNDPNQPKTRPRATTEVGRSRPSRHSHDHSSSSSSSRTKSSEVRGPDIIIPSRGIGELMANTARRMSGAGVGALGTPMTPTEIADDIKRNEEMMEREEANSKNGKKRLPTLFKYSGKAKDVYVCGTFTNWQRMRMNRSTKDFVALVDLPEGSHEYKFLVDGKWINDKNGQLVEDTETTNYDDSGLQNNVIHVQKGDFNAYDALDMDSDAVKKMNANKKFQASDEFGQEMPNNMSLYEHKSGPPILPPHLLQVILNKDTPLSVEPTLLPEPNRVMINHLYALSIKDGVMVLSSTQRFKKKYVTTLLYKPMS